MEGLFVLITIFNYTFGVILAYLFGGNQSLILRVIAVGVLLFSVVEYQSSLYSGKKKVKEWFNTALVLALFVYAWMVITYVIHGTMPDIMKTYFLTFPTKVISAIFMSYAFIRKNLILKINKWINIFACFYTITLLSVVQSNQTAFSRTLAIDRQTLSYAGAYSFMMLLFVNMNFNKINKFRLLSNKYMILLNYAFMGLDLYIILAGGGRGAFLVVACGVIYYVFKNISTFNFKEFVKIILIIAAGVFAVSYFSTAEHSAEGFGAIRSLFEDGFTDQSSQDRIELYTTAWYYVKQAFYLGNGAGSTAYTVGFYTHNIFMDILVEYGVWGIAIIVFFIIRFLRKVRRYSSIDPQMDFLAIVFMCSFVMLVFSGSMYSETALWFSLFSANFVSEEQYYLGNN